MAEALGHRWGQIIGEILEEAVLETFAEIATRQGLYLDYKKPRRARGGAKNVGWQDRYGNKHNLDYVFERGGTEESVGSPAAFIETAWRRYTKHSKNKAQEIEAAVAPVAENFNHYHPFLGVIVAGVFTPTSLEQLRSRGFKVIYVSYADVVAAFRTVGIDASFDEGTADDLFRGKIDAFERLSADHLASLKAAMLKGRLDVQAFVDGLEGSFGRRIQGITMVALHGEQIEVASAKEAIDYLVGYAEEGSRQPVIRYEIDARYTNGDVIHAIFQDKGEAIKFLESV